MKLTTGKFEEKYKSINRKINYIISGIEALPTLIIAGIIKIIIFNINGLIKNN